MSWTESAEGYRHCCGRERADDSRPSLGGTRNSRCLVLGADGISGGIAELDGISGGLSIVAGGSRLVNVNRSKWPVA